MIDGLIEALLTSSAVRTLINHLVVKCVAEIFHRRAVDPEYLRKSDEAFAKSAEAKTEEERVDADRALSALLSS